MSPLALRGRAFGLMAVIACASAFAACGGSKDEETASVAATSTPAATIEAVTTDTAAEEIPGDTPAEETTTEEAPAEDNAAEEDPDVTAVKQAVAVYLTDVSEGDGEGVCSRMTDDGVVAAAAAFGVESTGDEAFATCVDSFTAAGSEFTDEDRENIGNAELSDVVVDGDTATLHISMRENPVTLVRGETGWLVESLPTS